VSLGDLAAGLFAAIDILGSLLSRERGGKRRRVDISMLDCQLALLENAVARHLNTGIVPGPLGTRHPSVAPFEAFAAADQRFVVAVDGEAAWQRFCRALELKQLATDPRFAQNELRIKNRDALASCLNERFAVAPAAVWIDRLLEAQVPAAPVNDLPAAMAEPQIQARQMISTVKMQNGSELQFVACPIGERLADRAPPVLNE
jgi:CoA:oxalate CoA-transferase